MLIKGSIRRHSNFKCYVFSDRPSEYYMKQKLTELKGEINNSTIKFRDFCTPSSIMNSTIRCKVNKVQKTWKHYQTTRLTLCL